jgi:hypothetical protein
MISVPVALIALLRAVHVPWGVLNALVVLLWIAVLFSKQLMGPAQHVQISSPTFEYRINNRYFSESNQLSKFRIHALIFLRRGLPAIPASSDLPSFSFYDYVAKSGGSNRA